MIDAIDDWHGGLDPKTLLLTLPKAPTKAVMEDIFDTRCLNLF